MNDIWEFLKNIAILFSIFGISLSAVILKSYSVVKARVDIRQNIQVNATRPNRLWYWAGFGFVLAYILFFIYLNTVVDLASYTQILSANEDAENLISALLWDLPIAIGAMLVGYVYGRKIFKR